MRTAFQMVRRATTAAIAAAALAACGAAATPSAQALKSPPPPSKGARSAATSAVDDHRIPRSAVHEVVSRGLGAFLQHVELADQPALLGGKFHGFRIATLADPAFWQGVDLKVGDVVTTVNGFPIEHPEQAEVAFESLEVASELRVAYERDGQTRELVFAIVDDL